MHRSEIHRLDPSREYWVPAVVAPHRNWTGSPGCRTGARYLVDQQTFRANREHHERLARDLETTLEKVVKGGSEKARAKHSARGQNSRICFIRTSGRPVCRTAATNSRFPRVPKSALGSATRQFATCTSRAP